MPINYFDAVVLCVLVLFALRGLMRGFVGEISGLVALVGGVWLAHRFYAQVAQYLTLISDPMWRNAAAYAVVFIAVLITVGLIARILRAILTFSFVAWADKAAGLILGAIKGILICAVLLLFIQHFAGNAAFLRESKVLPYLQAVIAQARAHIPPDLLKYVTPK